MEEQIDLLVLADVLAALDLQLREGVAADAAQVLCRHALLEESVVGDELAWVVVDLRVEL